jgi:glycosyltransferase involved in cell wall biosynthesis
LLVLDPDEELIEFYRKNVPEPVKIVVSSGVGLSHARNTGVKQASGVILAFIDDDALADPQWIEYGYLKFLMELRL